jgi:small subunit ribosomal protein S16
VKIKLKRLGRTRVPTYRIVVADARTKRDGRAIEEIGKYHPKEEPSFIEVNSERAQHWLSVGAQPTEPVLTILKITGDWQKFKGEPGAEGTLRTRETAPAKAEVFAEALKTAAKDSGDSGSTTPKGGGRSRKSDSKAKADADTKDAATKADAKAETKTDAKAETKADAKAETKADAKAETKADAKDAKAETKDVKPESGRSKSKASAEKPAAGAADESAAAAATADDAAPAEAETATADASASSESGSEA